ncbi:MAG: trehalose-phosphatase [Actinomycetota bacterium]
MTREHIATLTKDPMTTGLFLDFDGTLSDIVLVPAAARPLEGSVAVLHELVDRFGLVAIVSGRSAEQLLEWMGPKLEIWGTHGAQRVVDGKVTLSDHAVAFAELMRRVYSEAKEALDELAIPGAVLEDKRIMIGLHFRATPDPEDARVALDKLAQELADRHGLRRAGGRLAYELRPPAEFTKAAVVLERSLELGLESVAFFGDDRVDLPAFDALDDLSERGLATVRIAVRSDEAPPGLLERADEIVDGPSGTLAFLRELVRASGG